MEKILADLQAHPLAWAFLQPVNIEEVPDYPTVVKSPMGETFIPHVPFRLFLILLCSLFARLLLHRFQYDGAQVRYEPILELGCVRGGCAVGFQQLQVV